MSRTYRRSKMSSRPRGSYKCKCERCVKNKRHKYMRAARINSYKETKKESIRNEIKYDFLDTPNNNLS